MPRRANYARRSFQQRLGPSANPLDVSCADVSGDSTDRVTFTVPTDAPVEPYVEMQVYDIGELSHGIQVNGAELTGFDIAPGKGWQYWMDTIADTPLHQGENTIQSRRDRDTNDAFVVGMAVVHRTDPADRVFKLPSL